MPNGPLGIVAGYSRAKRCAGAFACISEEQYLDSEKLAAEYKEMICEKIEEADLESERQEACMIR